MLLPRKSGASEPNAYHGNCAHVTLHYKQFTCVVVEFICGRNKNKMLIIAKLQR